MPTPAIAHFGTTLIESPPPDGIDQKDVPFTSDLARTDRFLSLLGMTCYVRNMYEGVGRQFIYRRGAQDDVDYIEKDTFTSYRAVARPDAGMPRVGDTVFRLTHADPVGIYKALQAESLIETIATGGQEAAFLSGKVGAVLFMGPDGQQYELCATGPSACDNHVVYIWTDHDVLAETVDEFTREFGFGPASEADFHGIAKLTLIRRETPGMTLGFITPFDKDGIAPRWTDDIFLEAGYSHYRLASPDMAHTVGISREAFPQGGDVAFVYFRESYIELVQIHEEDEACQEKTAKTAA